MTTARIFEYSIKKSTAVSMGLEWNIERGRRGRRRRSRGRSCGGGVQWNWVGRLDYVLTANWKGDGEEGNISHVLFRLFGAVGKHRNRATPLRPKNSQEFHQALDTNRRSHDILLTGFMMAFLLVWYRSNKNAWATSEYLERRKQRGRKTARRRRRRSREKCLKMIKEKAHHDDFQVQSWRAQAYLTIWST